MNPAATAPAPAARGWLRSLWRLAFLAFAVVSVVVALAIGLFRVLVPMVPDFHERIEAAAGQALGVPVTVEALDVRWRWRGPELVFRGVRVLDTDGGRALLEARYGHVNLNVGAFVAGRGVVPDFVVLGGVDIEVFRDAAGEFSVLGRRAMPGEAAPLSPADGWPLPDGLYVVRDSSVRYTQAEQAPIVVSDVNADIEVSGRRLRLEGKLVPPQGMGESLEVTAELTRAATADHALLSQVYLAGSELQLSAVNRIAGATVFPISAGQGDIVAWAQLDGLELRDASLDLDATEVTMVGGSDPYRALRGRVELDTTALGWRLTLRDFLVDRGAQAWPALNATLSFDEGPGGARRYHVELPFARLDDVWPLAELAPPGAWRTALAAHQPQGEVHDLDVVIETSPDTRPVVAATGRFQRLGWLANDRIPGVSGLSGRARIDAFGGQLSIDTDSITVTAPDLFVAPVSAWRLAGAASWTRDGERIVINSDNILLATEHFDALAKAAVRWQPGSAPVVDFEASVGDLDIAAGLSYLPVGVMKPRLVTWLTSALQGGTVRAASVVLNGALDEFPFDAPDQDGEFRASLEVEDLVMAFARQWPAVHEVDSRVEFVGRRLEGAVSDGLFGAARLRSAQVTIDNLKDAVVEVNLDTRAPLEAVHEYIVGTPVGEKFARVLRDLKPRGPASTSVSLALPVRNLPALDYQVDIKPDRAVLAYRDWPVELEDIRGSVVIGKDGVSAPDASGVLLSRPVTLNMRTVPLRIDGVDTRQVVINASGRTDANVFAQRIHPPLANYLSGLADWDATIALPPAQRASALPTTVEIRSALAGLAVDLPVPLAKPADAARELSATLAVREGEALQVDLALGESISAALAVDTDNGWRVLRGTVAANDGVARLDPRAGVALRGRVELLDVDAWLALFKDRDGAPSERGLRTANIEFGQARVFGQSLSQGAFSVDRNAREWLIEVEAPEASGAIFLPRDYASFREPVIANLQRLRWRPGADDAPGVDPRTLPSLRLDVQDFWFDDMNFGQLSAEARHVEDGLSLEQISMTGRGFTGRANGAWRYAGGSPSAFSLTIDSTDVRATMEALGSVGAIDSDEATFALNLNWDDELDSGFLRDVYGQVSIAVGDGNLISVDPGGGRVFGLISLAALPRRLGLDFRDVFQKGFAFDAIEGNFSIRNGNAFTDNLTLRGPAAQVAVVGRAGVAERDYEQTASVYANFGSSLPIAGAIAGGPAVGAALLIFSEVFKDPLKQVSRVDYRITGSWEDPQIARISAVPAPQSDPLPEAAPQPQADPVAEPPNSGR